MKKFFIAALTTTIMVSAARAGNISLDMRADHVSDNYNNEVSLRNSSRYLFKTVRINYEGKVNEDLSFRLRGAYNKNATAQTTTPAGGTPGDNSVTALEYAYLTHKMGDLALSVGKVSSDQGGLEGATTGPELYLTSVVYTKTGVNGVSLGSWIKSSDLLYVTGAKLSYSITPEHMLSLIAFEAPGATTTDNANMTGLVYRGSLMDKSMRLMASYHAGNGIGTTADKYELYSLGVGWSMDPVVASVEYVSSGFKADLSGAKDIASSIIGKFAYTDVKQWIPRLEVISSENKVETNGTAALNRTHKSMSYGAVIEYRPVSDFKDFRYHLAYHNINQDQAVGGNMNVQEITVGARLYADFLK